MSKVKVKLNSKGIDALLKGPESRQLVTEHAIQTIANAGDGYDHREHNTGQRIASNVYPVTKEAYLDNLENNTLLRALR